MYCNVLYVCTYMYVKYLNMYSLLGVRDQAEFKNKRRLENLDMWFILNL